jgi:hypothetical protein
MRGRSHVVAEAVSRKREIVDEVDHFIGVETRVLIRGGTLV